MDKELIKLYLTDAHRNLGAYLFYENVSNDTYEKIQTVRKYLSWRAQILTKEIEKEMEKK